MKFFYQKFPIFYSGKEIYCDFGYDNFYKPERVVVIEMT